MRLTPFRRVLAATGLSDTANGLFTVAAVVTAAQSSRSAAVVALVTAAATLPWLLFAIPAGMLVDSVSRRRAMTYANLGRGAVMLCAAALVAAGVSPVPVLVAAVFTVSSLQTVVDTAAEAFVPDLVPAARLSHANGSLAVATRISNQFAGPMLAGFLVTVATSAAALAAGTACVLAAALLRRSPGGATRGEQVPGPRRRTSVRTGVTAILRRPVLVTLIGVGAVTTIGNGAFLTVFAVYGLAPGPLGLTPPQYGVALGAIGVGAAVGSFLTGRFEDAVGRGHVLWLTRVGWALVFMSPAFVSGRWLVVVLALGSAFGGMWAVEAMSIRQRTVPPHERGQIAGVSRLVQYGSAPVGAALGGALSAFTDARAIFVGSGVAALSTIIPIRVWLSEDAVTAAEAAVQPTK